MGEIAAKPVKGKEEPALERIFPGGEAPYPLTYQGTYLPTAPASLCKADSHPTPPAAASQAGNPGQEQGGACRATPRPGSETALAT